MAEPSFVAAGAYLEGDAANAPVAVPAGAVASQVAVVTLFLDGAALAVDPTPPSGFQAAPSTPVQIPSGSGNHTLYVWWKRLTAGDTGTWMFTWSGSRYREAIGVLYSNVVATGDPWDLPVDTAADLTSSTVTPAVDVTSLGPDRRLVWSATNWSGGTWTAPTGFTKRAQGGAGVFTTCDRSWPTAGNTGAITGTSTNSDKRNAWLGALIGTTGGSTPTSGGTAAAAVTGTVTARKVVAVAATVSVASTGVAMARKVAPAVARSALAATGTGAGRKVAPAAGRGVTAVSATTAARKSATAHGLAAAAATSSAAVRKRAPATGASHAALWSYRSQVLSRQVTAVCSAVFAGSVAARKVLPATATSALAACGRASSVHVGLSAGVASVAALGRVQVGHVVTATGRSTAMVGAVATARKVAPVGGLAYAAMATSWVAQQPPPTRGSLAAGFRRGPGMDAGPRRGSRIAMAERRGPEMGAQ